METAEKTRVKPEFTIKKGAFYPCDGAFKVGEFRYESCGMRSYYFALVNGVQLSYCGHHGDKYEVGLLPIATKIIDLRHTILDASPSVN